MGHGSSTSGARRDHHQHRPCGHPGARETSQPGRGHCSTSLPLISVRMDASFPFSGHRPSSGTSGSFGQSTRDFLRNCWTVLQSGWSIFPSRPFSARYSKIIVLLLFNYFFVCLKSLFYYFIFMTFLILISLFYYLKIIFIFFHYVLFLLFKNVHSSTIHSSQNMETT